MKKIIIVFGIITVLGIVVFFVVDNTFPKYDPEFTVKEIHSNILKKDIYLKKKSWGISYDSEVVVISTSPEKHFEPDSTKDYIFLDPEIFYKVSQDTLYIYTMSKAKKPEKFDSQFKIKQIRISNPEKMELMGNANYKKKDLHMIE